VALYTDAVLTDYFGEYSTAVKSFLINTGRSEAFKEYATFCAKWMLLRLRQPP
jgi:hypothetical protein